MDNKLKLLISLVVVPNLRALSGYFAMKDADNQGGDDRLARILGYAADELERYMAEIPVPARA